MHALKLVQLAYRLFELAYIGTVDDSLESFRTYVRWHSQAHGLQMQANMYAVVSIRRLRQHMGHVISLVRQR